MLKNPDGVGIRKQHRNDLKQKKIGNCSLFKKAMAGVAGGEVHEKSHSADFVQTEGNAIQAFVKACHNERPSGLQRKRWYLKKGGLSLQLQLGWMKPNSGAGEKPRCSSGY